MKMKTVQMWYAVVFIGVSLVSCGKQQEVLKPIPQVQQSQQSAPPAEEMKKTEVKAYAYTAINYRDPFVPLNVAGSAVRDSQDTVVPSIDMMLLKGIFDGKKQGFALIEAGGRSYVLKENILYDSRRRPVSGIKGTIKAESVLIIDAAGRKKELMLKKDMQ